MAKANRFSSAENWPTGFNLSSLFLADLLDLFDDPDEATEHLHVRGLGDELLHQRHGLFPLLWRRADALRARYVVWRAQARGG